MIDDAIAYATRYEPAFPSQIKGAAAEEIALLRRRAGDVFPPEYLRFLERMGHGTGGLPIAFDGTTDISYVLEVYADSLTADELPEGCLYIGGRGQVVDSVYLWRKHGETTFAMYHAGFDEEFSFYAASLGGLIKRLAFHRFVLNRMPHSRDLATARREPVLARIAAAAEQLGARPLPFSDAVGYCAEIDGGAVSINQFVGDGALLVVAGSDERRVAGLADTLGRQFALIVRER